MEPLTDAAEHGMHWRQASVSKEARRLNRILGENDLYVALFKLKCGHFKQPVCLDEPTLERLSGYIERYTSHTHIIDTCFGRFMNNFLRKVKPASIGLHMRCLSYLEDTDLVFFRRLYGYSRIYQVFKEAVAGLFSYDTPSAYLVLLIRLLDNNQLVYKNLLPVILRMKSYVEKDFVDKNIGACCSALNAIARCCPEYFNEVLTASLLDYLARLLHTPQNYLFLTEKDIAAILETFSTLSNYAFRGSLSRNNSIGLLRECIGKVVEYRSSTVDEEMQVVVRMTEILTAVFNMCLKQGQASFSFIDPTFLDLEFMKPAEKKRCEKEINREPKPAFPEGTASPGSQNSMEELRMAAGDPAGHAGVGGSKSRAVPAKWQAKFIIAKYRFLDYADPYISGFKRDVFYNDLLHVENVAELFGGMHMLKKKLDWCDLITYACRSSCRPSYMPVLFDEYFTGQPRHIEYVRLFLKNVATNPEYCIYFARIAIDKRCDSILMDIYLLDRTSNPMAVKTRNMILRYLSKYRDESDNRDSSEADEKYLAKLKRRLKRGPLREERDSGMDRIIADCIEKLSFYDPCPALAALFTVFVSNSIRVSSHVAVYNYMRASLAKEGGDERTKISYAAISAAILVRSGADIFDVADHLENYYDALIAFLNYRGADMSDKKHYERMEREGFRVVFGCSPEQLAELGAVSGHGSLKLEDSACWKEYTRINYLIEAGGERDAK